MSTDELLTARRLEQKARGVGALSAALAVIEAQGRAPDDWECARLWYGIMALVHGAYDLAANEGHLVRVPPEKRSPQSVPAPAEIKNDAAYFRRSLASAEAAPLRLYPHLGPLLPG